MLAYFIRLLGYSFVQVKNIKNNQLWEGWQMCSLHTFVSSWWMNYKELTSLLLCNGPFSFPYQERIVQKVILCEDCKLVLELHLFWIEVKSWVGFGHRLDYIKVRCRSSRDATNVHCITFFFYLYYTYWLKNFYKFLKRFVDVKVLLILNLSK